MGRTWSLAKRGIYSYFTHKPFCVSCEVTYRCNARCRHCHLHGVTDNHVASPKEYGEICKKLKPVVAQVSGGEPLLRKDIEQIISALRVPNKAPYIIITTNGVLLTKEKYFQLREAGVDEFSLSLDYPDERHDEFRQVPGLFNRIEKLMDDLNGIEKKAITVSCVIQSDNYKDAIGIAKLAKKWNINANYSTYTWLRTKNMDYMIPKDEMDDFRKVINDLLEYKRRYKNVRASEYVLNKMIDYFENGEVPGCRAGERFLIVNPDGSLSPCGLITGNYHTQKQIETEFGKTNECNFCYTSIRANTEKPVKYLIKDNLNSN